MAIHVGMATAASMTWVMIRVAELAIMMTPNMKLMGMTTSAGISIFSDFLTAP